MWPPCGITDVKNVYGKLLFLVLSGFCIWEWGTSFSSLSSYNLLLRGQHCDFVHAPCIYALVPPEMSRMVQGATQKPHGEDTVTGRNQNSLPKSHPALHKNSNLQILHNKTSKEASILCKLKYRNGAVKRTLGSYSALFGCGVAAKGVLLLFGRTAQNPQQTHSLPSLHTEEVLPCPAGLQDLFLKAKHFKRFNEIKL